MDTIDDWIEESPLEFDCPGCGRLIIAICAYKMSHPVCGACMSNPGWYLIPELRKALDPFGDINLESVTMTPVEVECRAVWLAAALRWLHRGTRIVEDQVEPFAVEQTWHDRTLH